ncbi:hypothetical protein FKM82_009050 [Ascaphus truei]
MCHPSVSLMHRAQIKVGAYSGIAMSYRTCLFIYYCVKLVLPTLSLVLACNSHTACYSVSHGWTWKYTCVLQLSEVLLSSQTSERNLQYYSPLFLN